jgi:hypothetical protein
MQIPSYGAAPISATFLIARVLQLVFLIIILGMTANFVNGMVMANHDPSKEIVGALVIVRSTPFRPQTPLTYFLKTSIATLYTLVSISFYWASAHLGLFVMAAFDFLIFIAFVVVSVSIGRPVSYLNCYHRFQNLNGDVLKDLQANWNEAGSTLNLGFWSGMNKSNCFETKAIWGFCIALT